MVMFSIVILGRFPVIRDVISRCTCIVYMYGCSCHGSADESSLSLDIIILILTINTIIHVCL